MLAMAPVVGVAGEDRSLDRVYRAVCESLPSLPGAAGVQCVGAVGDEVELAGTLSKTGFPVVLVGGDHSATLRGLHAVRRLLGPRGGLGLVVFDAHLDARAGGPLRDRWLAEAVREKLVNCVYHVGSVGLLNEPGEAERLKGLVEAFQVYPYDMFFRLGGYDEFLRGLKRSLQSFLEECSARYWYVSMDADYIDSPYVLYPYSPNPLGVAPVDALMHLKAVIDLVAGSGGCPLAFDLTEFGGAKEPGILPATLAAAIVAYASQWLDEAADCIPFSRGSE